MRLACQQRLSGCGGKSYRRTADVVVDVADLSDAKRAQIEDIVTRKAEVNAANVVITPIHESTNTSESGD